MLNLTVDDDNLHLRVREIQIQLERSGDKKTLKELFAYLIELGTQQMEKK